MYSTYVFQKREAFVKTKDFTFSGLWEMFIKTDNDDISSIHVENNYNNFLGLVSDLT